MAKKKKKQLSQGVIWTISFTAVVILFSGGFFVTRALLSEDEAKKKRAVQMVTLVKLPPPPKIEEKPHPEPEVRKKEEIMEPKQEKIDPQQAKDDKPASKNLGLDAEGGPGSDGFGLVGNKGGRGLIGGGSLLGQYGWYANLIQDEINRKVRKILEEQGGMPKGKLQATVKIILNDGGRIVNYQISSPSGNPRLDEALKTALGQIHISQQPPDGMPRSSTMNIRVSSQG